MFESILGIDFREDSVTLTILKGIWGKMKIAGIDYIPYPPGQNKEEQELFLKSRINEFISKSGIRKERVIISIPRERLIYRLMRFPSTVKENLRRVIEYESPKYIPFERGEALFDFQILKKNKEWIDIFSVFVRKKEVDYYLSLLKSIGITPQWIQIPTSAALTLFGYHQKSKDGGYTILIEMEKNFWELNVLKEGVLKESVLLPIEGETDQPNLMPILYSAGMKEAEVRSSHVFFYGRHQDGKRIEERGFKPTLAPLEKVSLLKNELNSNAFYTSIGLPLCGLVKPFLEINLLPLEKRIRKIQVWKPIFYVILSLTLFLSVLLPIGEWMGYRTELQKIKELEKGMKPEVSALEVLEKEKEGVLKEVLEFEKVMREEVSKIEILKEITKILPPSVWIWNLKFKSNEIEISGFADSASDLVTIIDRSPLFEKVEFLAPVTKEKFVSGEETKEKERFKIKARIEGAQK